jgi:hypothetical protein
MRTLLVLALLASAAVAVSGQVRLNIWPDLQPSPHEQPCGNPFSGHLMHFAV